VKREEQPVTDAHAYTVSIRRDVFDGETLFEARVREFPDVREYAPTHEEAYTLVIDAIDSLRGALAAQSRAMPEPVVPVDDYSGRVTLRLPRSLHRALSESAEQEGVSLNTHLVCRLSAGTGTAGPTATD
jgi:predicted HicB family RNase H-like nuclease